jgi:surface polysaccharide O-acyltransferase-like enzyme
MGLFFFISGYFTLASFDRKGPRQFCIDRLMRLGIPLVVYDWLINPLTMLPLFLSKIPGYEGNLGNAVSWYYSQFHFGTGPLWFVETILIFSVVYVLWRWVSKSKPVDLQSGTKVPGMGHIGILALVLGIISFIIRIWLPIGWSFKPLNLQFPFFPQYIVMFILGIFAFRNQWLDRFPDSFSRFWLWQAGILVMVLIVLFVIGGAVNGDPSRFIGGFHWQSLGYSLWEQFTGVALIVGLLVAFRRHFNRQSPLLKAASDSAYGTYIIHGIVLVYVSVALRSWHLYPLAKFFLVGLIVVLLSFIIAWGLRQLPGLNRIV